MSRNALNDLNIANGTRKIPKFYMDQVMVYIQCIKISKSNGCSNGRFAFIPCSFSLENTFLPRRRSSFQVMYITTFTICSQIYNTAFRCHMKAPCQFSCFSKFVFIF